MEFSQKIDIIGIIMPSNWNETGTIIEIALYTNTEEVYVVERNSLTEELLHFIYQRIEIKGEIRKYPDGRKAIVVRKYKPLQDFINDE